MNDSHYIKQSVRDDNFSKRADDAGRLYKSHAVADDIARELAEALQDCRDALAGMAAMPYDESQAWIDASTRFEQVMGNE